MCTARAIRAPQADRGPAKSSAASPGETGAATHTASVVVPVPGNPASSTACVLASVAVMMAFTSAASVSGTGTETMILIVPGASSGSSPPAGAAAQVGTRRPAVTAAAAPSSERVARSVTWAAVSIPVPGPVRPSQAASSVRCPAGSVRAYCPGTCALSTHSRGPIPPPSTPLEIIR